LGQYAVAYIVKLRQKNGRMRQRGIIVSRDTPILGDEIAVAVPGAVTVRARVMNVLKGFDTVREQIADMVIAEQI
jgi:hypothetical protein